MTEALLVQKLAYILPVWLEREWVPVSFVSFENYDLQMRKKFSTFFSCLFLPKKPSLKKFLTPCLGENIAYGTLVQYKKPWTLYLVLEK